MSLSNLDSVVASASGGTVMAHSIGAPNAAVAAPQTPAPTPSPPQPLDTRVAVACNECVRAKMRCSSERPCKRCVRRGQEHLCVDRDPKRPDLGRKRRRKQVPSACIPCSTSKTACDNERPCRRCQRRGESHLCQDRPRARRGRWTASASGSVASLRRTKASSASVAATAAFQTDFNTPHSCSVPGAPMSSAHFSAPKTSSAAVLDSSSFADVIANPFMPPFASHSISNAAVAVPPPHHPPHPPQPPLPPQVLSQSDMSSATAAPPFSFSHMQNSAVLQSSLSRPLFPLSLAVPFPLMGQQPQAPPPPPPIDFALATTTNAATPLVGRAQSLPGFVAVTESIAMRWRFAYRGFPPATLREFLRSKSRMTVWSFSAIEYVSKKCIQNIFLEIVLLCAQENYSDFTEFSDICSQPIPDYCVKYEAVRMVLNEQSPQSSALAEPYLTIGDDDLLRIAFWESQCAVIRMGLKVHEESNGLVSVTNTLSMNKVAEQFWGFSHAELDVFAKEYSMKPEDFNGVKVGKPVPFIWRFFSERSHEAMSIKMVERHMVNLSQVRIDLEAVCRDGLVVPCRSYWKYRCTNGEVNDVLVAVKPLNVS